MYARDEAITYTPHDLMMILNSEVFSLVLSHSVFVR